MCDGLGCTCFGRQKGLSADVIADLNAGASLLLRTRNAKLWRRGSMRGRASPSILNSWILQQGQCRFSGTWSANQLPTLPRVVILLWPWGSGKDLWVQIMKMALGDIRQKEDLRAPQIWKRCRTSGSQLFWRLQKRKVVEHLSVAPDVPWPQTATNLCGSCSDSGPHKTECDWSSRARCSTLAQSTLVRAVGCHLPILGGFREREVLVSWQRYRWLDILVYILDIHPSHNVHSWKIQVMAEIHVLKCLSQSKTNCSKSKIQAEGL